MARWDDRRARMRALLASSACSFPASVHDPIAARIAQQLDYHVGIFAGSVASLTVLGEPDIILLTLTEFAEQAMRISRGSDLPLLVDADHGYGNALNVMRCVEELEAAGVSALSIEDTELPAPAGSHGKARLTTLEEGVGKMRAALAARGDPALVIAGRTSAAGITDAADAARRLRAYEDAGVDVLFAVGVKDLAGLQTIAAATTLPLILGSAPRALHDPAILADNRVRICLLGHQPFAAAVQAIHDTLKRMKQGEDPASLPGVAPDSLMKSLTHAEGWRDRARKFLDGDS